jgi:acyl carrier protein
MSTLMTLERRITSLFSRDLNLDVPSADLELIDSGLVDSLTFVEILARLEEEFGFVIALEDVNLDHFRTIARMAGFVAARLSVFQDDHRHGQASLVADAEM